MPPTRVVRVDAAAPDLGAIRQAAQVLRAGGLVGFPTETFYGLGAAGLDAAAVRRVFSVKGRPSSMPLLLLVDSRAMMAAIAPTIPPQAAALMERHWPGPLTLVLRASAVVPTEVTAGTGTVGVRVSAHPVARALVRALGEPITAPSANPTGGAPPVTADDVLAHLDGRIELLLDAGPTPGGAPSTVLDVTVEPPRVLRQGAVLV
ncbi:MAG TPA: L-threonylcarbamoyladenylate synthase [Methylomirabilota bacterium]|nr:L-threonylcarbamoyladenylate synthase [Methylomirabilota bacterium]